MQNTIAAWTPAERDNPSEPRKTIRGIAAHHGVNHSTLWKRCQDGYVSRYESDRARGHMTPAEEEVLVVYLLARAERGFPPTRRAIAEKATAILRARLGPSFKLGKHWVERFLARQHDRLVPYWSSPCRLQQSARPCHHP